MKKDFEAYLYDVGQKVSMTSSEKEAILSHLKNTIEARREPEVSPYAPFSFFRYQRIAGLAFAVLFIVGGVASASAERSFPGDPLYSFKVGVNEEVRGWFSKTPIAKAEWSIQLAERRLYELESIQNNDTVSQEMQKTLEETFALQVEKAEQSTREYESPLLDLQQDVVPEQPYETTAPLESRESIEDLSAKSLSKEISSFTVQPEVRMENESQAVIFEMSKKQSVRETQVEDVRQRIRALRKSLQNAKNIGSLEKGKILRLEARLLQSQRALIAFEKKDISEREKDLNVIIKSVVDIEKTLNSLIPDTPNVIEGEVLSETTEGEKQNSDFFHKEKNSQEADESRDPEAKDSVKKMKDNEI